MRIFVRNQACRGHCGIDKKIIHPYCEIVEFGFFSCAECRKKILLRSAAAQ